MVFKTSFVTFLLGALLVAAGSVSAQRERTRPTWTTEVTPSQANELTLTLTKVEVRPIQTVVRTAGAADAAGKILTLRLDPPDAGLIKVGQRIRAFTPDSKSSMYQARIARVRPNGAGVIVEAEFRGQGRENSALYVVEIAVENGEFLSIPNEAIIEEGDKRVVYVEMHPGHYLPHEVETGLQGELYTQVSSGLKAGDQVVTFGSFFIDSDYKLKTGAQGAMHDHSGGN
jgi:Cu(I)/Ag(I) efflux system membrane fusion protein